jgi:adenylyltransferase/sulfurtransferase
MLQSVATTLTSESGPAVLTSAVEAVDYSRLADTPLARNRVGTLQTVVVGAGALGNEVAKALGLLGVGQVLVVDPDLVELSNLTRSVLFRTPGAVGRNKADTLTEASSGLFPDTRWRSLAVEFADVGFQDLAAADLIFGCVDNDMARLEMAYAASKLERPVCDGGLGGAAASRGRVSWFPGHSGACASCRLRGQTRRELLTQWEAPRHPCWGDAESDQADFLPSTPTMAAIVGSMQVEIGLKRVLAGREESLESFSVDIDLSAPMRLETIAVQRSESCPFHGGLEGILLPASAGATFRELLDSVSKGSSDERAVVVLDWPVCAEANCTDCGHRWQPLRRASAFRRSGLCPICGSRYVEDRSTIRRIDAESAWVDRTPAEIGLPELHLHTVVLERRDAI